MKHVKEMEWVQKTYMAKQATCNKGTDAKSCSAAGKMTCAAAAVDMCKLNAAKKCVPGDIITGKLTQ